MIYTTRNLLQKPEPDEYDYPGSMADNADIIDAAIAKCNFLGLAAPTVNDDEGDGYSEGSRWYYSGVIYECTDATAGAAVWRQIYPALGSAMAAGGIADAKLGSSYILANGTRPLTATWDAGSWQIRAETFQSDIPTGGVPLVVASTTKVPNLNVDLLDDQEGAYYAKASELADGWTAAGETWTYAAADAPNYTFTISGDKTAKYSPGMRVKLTQAAAVKYFLIMKVSYSSPNTTITVYGGTDYTLGATITNPFYSMVKCPAGFPMDPNKWTVSYYNAGDYSKENPAADTWYNIDPAILLTIPIGIWNVRYSCGPMHYNTATSGAYTAICATLSTANNSESDHDFTAIAHNGNNNAGYGITEDTLSATKCLVLTAKTTYYLNFKTEVNVATSWFYLIGSKTPTKISAVCAYL